MKRFELTPSCTAVIQQGDITAVRVDAIVNAANETLLGGGGVDGAIHRRAGPRLVEACRKIPEVRPRVRCPTGEARITLGFNLPCDHVIHTVGPIYRSAGESAPALASAYRSSLQVANEHRLSTVAFPAISCGVYGYPVSEAAGVAIRSCREHAGNLTGVILVLFGAADCERWLAVAEEILSPCSDQDGEGRIDDA